MTNISWPNDIHRRRVQLIFPLIATFFVSCAPSPGAKDDYPPPDVPSLTATAFNEYVELTWSPANNADRYLIFWSTAPGGTRELSEPHWDIAGQTSFRHEKLNNGQTYYYAIAAKGKCCVGEKSAELAATPVPPPEAPENLRAVLYDHYAVLKWDPAPNATRYTVYAGNTQGLEQRSAHEIESPPFVYENPAPGKPIYFVVTASNNSGTSGNSEEVMAESLLLSFAAGANHTCAIKTDKTLWCWGENGGGQLGLGDTRNRSSLAQVGADRNWEKIAGGAEHTCAIKLDRTLWCWGDNAYGQLGTGSFTSTTSPTQIGSGADWATVEAGAKHTCAIKADHSLWCWGNNTHSQLGPVPVTETPNQPLHVGSESDWSQVALGDSHTCALKSGGDLWCWGDNAFGKLGAAGDGKTPSRLESSINWVSIALGGDHSCGIKADTTLWCWGRNKFGQVGNNSTDDQSVPVSVGGGDWSSVALGDAHTCAVRFDKTPWCWGENAFGQLHVGDEKYLETPTEVSTRFSWHSVTLGENHTCVIATEKWLGCWGHNAHGQLGEGSTSDFNVPTILANEGQGWESVSAGWYHTCGIKRDRSLWCWGWTRVPEQISVAGLENKWVSVAMTANKTCAVHFSGMLLCGETKQDSGTLLLGVNVQLQRRDETLIIENSGWSKLTADVSGFCAARIDKSLWCTPEASIHSSWTEIDSDVDESAFSTHCYLKTNGSLWCDGESNGIDNDWRSVSFPEAVSPDSMCGIKTNGTLFCNGYKVNDDTDWRVVSGSTGTYGYGWCAIKTNGTLWCDSKQIENATDWHTISVGYQSRYRCGVKTDGTLWCWGANIYRELGDGTDIHRPSPVPVVSSALPWSSVVAGAHHTCAVLDDNAAVAGGKLFCWGNNAYGQLGDGSTTQKSTPVQIGNLENWTTIAAGEYHACGIHDSELWCWGDNADGQLGIGNNETSLEPTQVGTDAGWRAVEAGTYHTCALKVDNSLWCWGKNGYGQLGVGDRNSSSSPKPVGTKDDLWIMVTAGDNHTCAVSADISLRCWGANAKGQLGNGTSVDSLLPTPVAVPKPTNLPETVLVIWQTIAAGRNHTCALPYDTHEYYRHRLFCWGDHNDGQLGYGDGPDQLIPVAINLEVPWTSVAAGSKHTCGGTTTDSAGTNYNLWCWGDNNSGQLGDGTYVGKSSPVKTRHSETPYPWFGMAAGEKHTCAIRADATKKGYYYGLISQGSLWCWGDNTHGQLGSGP